MPAETLIITRLGGTKRVDELRAEGRARGAACFLPRSLHTIVVENLNVLDLTEEGALAAVGLRSEDLSSRSGSCQTVGAAGHFLRLAAVVAPSAASDGVVIATFESESAPASWQSSPLS